MGGFLLRKVGAALVVIVLASMLVFLGVRALPGDPALALGGEQRDPEVLAQIRHDYGLYEYTAYVYRSSSIPEQGVAKRLVDGKRAP